MVLNTDLEYSLHYLILAQCPTTPRPTTSRPTVTSSKEFNRKQLQQILGQLQSVVTKMRNLIRAVGDTLYEKK